MRRGLISGEIGGKMVHPRREACIIRLGLFFLLPRFFEHDIL